MLKAIVLGALVVILSINTIQKSHRCDHEPPIKSEDKIKLTNESLSNLVEILRFKTVSWEDQDKIDFGEFEKLWSFVQEKYSIIFEHDSTSVTWVNNYTMILKVKGVDDTLKPGLFIAHTDVVPVDDQWTTDAFNPVVTDKIQARGVFDCKGLFVAHLEAVKTKLLKNDPFARDVYWLFPHDEEIGGKGAQAARDVFREKFDIGPKGFEFIIDEGTPPILGLIPMSSDYFQMVGYTAKGGVHVEVSVELHNAGHGSIPARESSITVLNKALVKVNENPQPNMFGTSVEYNTFEGLTPYIPFPLSVITANLWLFGPLLSRLASLDNKLNAFIRSTTAITIVEAGYKENVIPTTARAIIDHRIHPAHSVAGVLSHLKKVINDDRVKIRVLPNSKEPDPLTPVDSIIGEKIKNSIHRTMKNTND